MNLNTPNYQAWLIDERDFPRHASIEQQINFLVGYGVLAPSTHNSQPWLFVVSGSTLTIAVDQSKLLPIGDPSGAGLAISLGACAENILQAAQAFGLQAKLTHKPEIITISFTASKTKTVDTAKLSAITQRQSYKQPYLDQPIAADVVKTLQALSDSSVTVSVVTAEATKTSMTQNHIEAAGNVASDPRFGRELSAWLRTNKTKAFDGMPGFVVGNSGPKSVIGKKLINKKPQILQKLVSKDAILLDSASAIIVFSVAGKVTAVEVGQVIERTWLRLTELGLAAQPLYASILDTTARKRLAKIVGTTGEPLFLMRLGYSKHQIAHTPRSPMKGVHMSSIIDTMKSDLKSHSMTIGAHRINYVTAGSGKPLVLIHGANIGWPQWHLNIDELAKNFKVYAVDMPGAGFSSRVNFRKTSFEKDYLEVVDEFIQRLGHDKVDIVGSSFGGWVAMRLAMAHKPYLDRLILANPIGFTRHMPLKFRPVSIWPLAKLMSKTALKPKRSNKNLEKFMRDVFYVKDQPLKPEFVDYFYELSKDSHNVLFISRLAHYSGMRKELFLGEGLKQITAPTMIIWGKQDPLMPYASVKDNFGFIKNARLELLDNVGHMPPVEDAERFNKLVTDFLKTK